MSQDLGTIYYEIDAKADGLLTQSKLVDRQIEKTEKGLLSVEKQMDKTNAASKELGGGLNLVTTALKAIAAASALREIASMVQGYQEMADRVRLATSSTQEFEAVQARLVQTANGTYRSLSEAQEVYIRTADSLRSMGYTTQEAMDVTDSLSYAFVTNATNAQKAGGAIDAMAKILAKGKVEADAWDTIVAATPSVIQAVATAAGKTSGEIRALGAAGKLTAAQLTEGLRKSLEGNAKAAAEMSNNLVDAKTRMVTALTAIFVEVENQTGAWQSLTDGIITAADWMLAAAGDADKMASFMDTASIAITATAAVIAGRLLTAFGSYALAQTRLIAGLISQALAERAAATAALASAQAQVAVALSAAERARATDAATAAQARLNAITTAGTVAMRGLGAAMALLGGPGGLLLLAAAAVYQFGFNSKNAEQPVLDLAKAVGELGTRALELQKIQLMEKVSQMGQLGEAASNSAARIETLQKNLREFPGSAKAAEWTRDLAEQRAAAEAAGTELETYKKRIADVDKELSNRASGVTSKPTGEPTLITPPDTKGEEAAAKKKQTLLEANIKAVKDLQQAEKEASLSAYELAEAQGLASLNKYATPEQIKQVKDLTRAIFDKAELVKNAAAEEQKALALQKGATAADPRTAAADQYKTDLEAYAAYKANQLITDQQYEELKNAAATQYEAQRLAAQEQMFAAQSRGNAFVMDSLNALAASSTQVISGLLSGTMNTQEALQALGNTIFNQVIGAVVEWGFAQVKAMIMGQTAQATATAAGIAQGTALAAAYTPAAIAASVMSFGAAPAAGAAGMAAAVPAMTAMLHVARKTGGAANANSMYRVNEGGAPEIFTGSNGSQYLLPNKNGQVVSNADATGGGTGGVTVQIINTSSRVQVRQEQGEDDMGKFVRAYIEDWESGGPMSQATMSMTNVQRVGS